MPKRKDIPPEGARMLATALTKVRRTYTGMLRDLGSTGPAAGRCWRDWALPSRRRPPKRQRSACASASAQASMPTE